MFSKIDKKLWLSYIKTYEDFNKKIPNELKETFNQVRTIIGNPTTSFKKSINLENLNFCQNIIHIDVQFNKINNEKSYSDKDITYYSNINIFDLISNKYDIDIPIKISDININIDKLISVISHEIRHIYDVFSVNTDSDMESFNKSLYYNILKNDSNSYFKDFMDIVYLSLEHELIARNTMIWEMFINCNCSKSILYDLFKKSFIYESFNILNNFDYTNLLKIIDIKDKVNNFINYFGGQQCINMKDVELFFNNWKIYFKNKSDEYIKKAFLVLDDVYELNENIYTKPIVKNVKEMLLDIHNKHIMKNNQ